MKKSRIAKLALSGAAVAALAATFSTSTYAWYVSNKTAKVEAGYGATGTAGSDGSIQVSWNTPTKSFSRSISFKDAGATHNAASARLQPVHYSATDAQSAVNAGFYGITSTGTQGSVAGANDVLTFTIVLKSNQPAGKKTLVTPSISFTGYGSASVASGTPATPTPAQQVLVGSYKLATSYDSEATYYTRTLNDQTNQYVYQAATVADAAAFAAGGDYYIAVTNGLPGKELNDTFTVDALKALYIQQNVTQNSNPVLSYADAWSNKITSCTDSEPTGADAHEYYTAVTGNTVWADEPVSATGLGTFFIVGTEELVVTYTIFLEGGDDDCFNNCVDQNFSFDLSFSAADPVNA